MARSLSRRSFLKVMAGSGIALSATSVMGYTIYGEPGWLDLTHVAVPIRNLPAALHGLTIAQLSDLHSGAMVSPAHIANAIALTTDQSPDLIVLTGDYVTQGADYIARSADALATLQAPLGTYAVLGNHDHSSGAPDRIMRVLESAGMVVLRNDHRRITVGTSAIWLAGVDDALKSHADIARAFRDAPEHDLRLLLAHEPDIADVAAGYGVHLQLSGHSHGGQIRLPLVGPISLPELAQRYPIGLQRVVGSTTWVYTNRGVGVTNLPVRFNCRPEVTILQLQRVTGTAG